MELVIHRQSKSVLKDINAVRMYLRVTMLSEITTSNGRLIGTGIHGKSPPFLQQHHILPNWPHQPDPSSRAWPRWRQLMSSISSNRKLKQPLGTWLHPPPRTWKFFTSSELPCQLLQKSGGQWLAHKRISGSHWTLYKKTARHILPPMRPQPT